MAELVVNRLSPPAPQGQDVCARYAHADAEKVRYFRRAERGGRRTVTVLPQAASPNSIRARASDLGKCHETLLLSHL